MPDRAPHVFVQVPKDFRNRRGGEAAFKFCNKHDDHIDCPLKDVAQYVLSVSEEQL